MANLDTKKCFITMKWFVCAMLTRTTDAMVMSQFLVVWNSEPPQSPPTGNKCSRVLSPDNQALSVPILSKIIRVGHDHDQNQFLSSLSAKSAIPCHSAGRATLQLFFLLPDRFHRKLSRSIAVWAARKCTTGSSSFSDRPSVNSLRPVTVISSLKPSP